MTISAKRIILITVSIIVGMIIVVLLFWYVLGYLNFGIQARGLIAIIFVILAVISTGIMIESHNDTIKKWYDTISCANNKLQDQECKGNINDR